MSKKKKNKLKNKLVVQDSGSGLGLFAKKDFKKEAVIGRIKGKVVSDENLDPRYVMELGNDMLLVPKAPFRYLNHSCKPNCELSDEVLQAWPVCTDEVNLSVALSYTLLSD